MIVVYVVKIDGKSPDDFRDTRVPSRIINRTVKVVHASWIRIGFRLLPEDRCVQ